MNSLKNHINELFDWTLEKEVDSVIDSDDSNLYKTLHEDMFYLIFFVTKLIYEIIKRCNL